MFVLAFLFSCTSPAPPFDLEAETQTLFNTDVAFAEASKSHGAPEAFRMYLAEDGLGFPSGSHVVRGRDAMYERMSVNTTGMLLWKPQHAEVAQSGDFGYTWGTYTYTLPGEANPVGYGKYINVWRKQADGTWKVIADIGNPSPAPTE